MDPQRTLRPNSGKPIQRALLRAEAATWLGLLRWWPMWLALGLFVAAMVAAYQVPHRYAIDVGSPSDEAYVRNFHTRLTDTSTGPTYRWSDVYGYVVFPGLGGSRPFTVTVTLDSGRQAPVQIIVNGEQMFSGSSAAGWRTITLRVDAKHPQALQSRDTVVELRSTDYRTEEAPTESKGVKVDSVVVEQDAQGSFIAPALSPLLWLSVALLLAYLAVGRALTGYASESRARLGALVVMVAGGVGLVVALAASHIGVAAASQHIVITLLTAMALALVCELALKARSKRMTALQCRLLAQTFAMAFVIRYAGMALPQSVIIDMPYHMKWLTTLLSGDWQALYFPGGLSVVPREWGMDILIPKSPLFYAAFSPLSILPFELETLVKWLICLLDSSLVLAVFWLCTRIQPRIGAALAAGGLYAIMPLDFRAFSYGILPTIFSQWLAALLVVALVAVGVKKWRPAVWTGMVVLAWLVFLSFPTVAVFVSLMMGGYALTVALRRRYYGGHGLVVGWQVVALLVVAWVLAVWAYYGLYIAPVLASAQALLAPRTGQTPTVRWPGGFGDLVASTADYVVSLLPILLAVAGFALLFAARRMPAERRRAFLLIVLWAAIGPIFFLVNYKVDMIGKHLFFTMLPVALAGGLALFRLSRKGRWGPALAGLAFALIGLQAILFWIQRLVETST
jgi:hypothetical protein